MGCCEGATHGPWEESECRKEGGFWREGEIRNAESAQEATKPSCFREGATAPVQPGGGRGVGTVGKSDAWGRRHSIGPDVPSSQAVVVIVVTFFPLTAAFPHDGFGVQASVCQMVLNHGRHDSRRDDDDPHAGHRRLAGGPEAIRCTAGYPWPSGAHRRCSCLIIIMLFKKMLSICVQTALSAADVDSC